MRFGSPEKSDRTQLADQALLESVVVGTRDGQDGLAIYLIIVARGGEKHAIEIPDRRSSDEFIEAIRNARNHAWPPDVN